MVFSVAGLVLVLVLVGLGWVGFNGLVEGCLLLVFFRLSAPDCLPPVRGYLFPWFDWFCLISYRLGVIRWCIGFVCPWASVVFFLWVLLSGLSVLWVIWTPAGRVDTYVLGCWVAFSGMAFDFLVLGGLSSALGERARLNLSLVRVCFVRFENVCAPPDWSIVRETGWLLGVLFVFLALHVGTNRVHLWHVRAV